MNNPPVPQPQRPSVSDTSGSADDDVPRGPDQSEPASHPTGGATGRPDRPEESGQAGDDDEYEPL